MNTQRYPEAGENLTRAKPDSKSHGLINDCYFSVQELSVYSGLSVSLIKSKLRGNGTATLPHFNTGKKTLIKKSEFDQWMEESYRVVRPTTSNAKVQHITNDICNQLGLSPSRS